MLVLIALLACPQLKQAIWPDKNNPHPDGYYRASFNDRINYSILYLGLVGFLSLMSYQLHMDLQSQVGD